MAFWPKTSIAKTRQIDTLPSCGGGICTTTHPLQYGTPLPPSPMPRSLQEMAYRWCHWFVCVVLTIEVYDPSYVVNQTGQFALVFIHITLYHLEASSPFEFIFVPYLIIIIKGISCEGVFFMENFWQKVGCYRDTPKSMLIRVFNAKMDK